MRELGGFLFSFQGFGDKLCCTVWGASVKDARPLRAPIRFGAFELDPESGELCRQGLKVKLQEQPFQILQILLEHPGKVVTREELQQRIWPADTFVDFDQGLYNATKKLREALGDSADNPRYIETLSRRGYRFIAPLSGNGDTGAVVELPPALETRSHRSLQIGIALGLGAAVLLGALLGLMPSDSWQRFFGKTAAPQIRSLAVLPLQSLSGDPAQEYFSDGMTDALITDLAQIGSIKVISRTSSMQYKQTKKSLPEIARELNVDGIVEGTVQRSGDRVRITAQLIHGPSDKHLWASTYERNTRDFFALERDVTADIARQIQVRLRTPEQGPPAQPRLVDPKVLEAYLQGTYHMNKFGKGGGDEERKRAAEYFQQAIDADPTFAPAWDWLSGAHEMLSWSSRQDAELVVTAQEKAVELDPNSAEIRRGLADLKWSLWDFRGAEAELRQALALNPNHADAHQGLGYVMALMGRPDEGMREAQIAQQLDPLGDHLEWAFYYAGEYDRAIAEAQRLLQSDPNNGFLHDDLYVYYATKGMYKEASEEAEKVMVLFGYPDVAARVHQALVTSGGREAIRQYGKEAERLMAAKRLYIPGHLAEIYAVLGDKDRAFYWLEEQYKHHDTAWNVTDHPLEWLKINHMLDSLHSDPRYKDLVRRVGLPE
jgi:TolB-like protein/DNA-binding winged helix-turn-helix (wHTH) protein